MNIKYIDIYPNTKKEKPEQPDYRIMAKVLGEYIEIGAGWKKVTKPSENFPQGRGYLSCKIDERLVELKETMNSDGTAQPSFNKVEEIKDTDFPF